jgi:hypothetical protein
MGLEPCGDRIRPLLRELFLVLVANNDDLPPALRGKQLRYYL